MTESTVTLPIRPTSATPGIEGTFAHYIERLKRQPARALHPQLNPDENDIQDRADTMRIWLRATQTMVSEYIKETADRSWAVHVDRREVERAFNELIVKLIVPIEIAAETVREEGSWRAA